MANLKFADTYNMVAFLSKPEESDGFEQKVDFLNAQPIKYALTINPTIHASCIEKFCSTVKAKTINGEVQLHALVDDVEGIDCLPNSTIFEELTRMGSKTIAWNEFSSTMASAIIYLATNQKFNFSKYNFESMVKNLDNVSRNFLMYPRIGEGSTMPTDPHHTPTIIESSTQPQKTQKPRKPKRKDTQVPQPSGLTGNVANEAVHKELGDSLLRAATTASSLEAEQDSDTIMSDSEDSTVTYTDVSSPFGGLSDIRSPGVDGPPVMPEDPYAYVVAAFQVPPSPDYVPGPEYPLSPDFVLEPVYPEFMPPKDEVLPAEEQPLPAATSPTADSPCYVPKSDPKEDPEEEDNEEPEEDHADYLADGGDDGDDEDESSDDDEDEDVDIEGDEEEEEHPAPADSTAVALPAVDQAPSAEETKPFETDESVATLPPHPAYLVTTRILIQDEPPTPFWSDTKVARLFAMPTLPPSPLSPWSSPLPKIPSPLPLILSPLPVSLPLPVSSPPPASPIRPLDAPSSGTPPLLPIPLLTSSPPLHLLSTDRRADRPEVTLPPQKRLGIALGLRYEVGESSSAPTTRPPRGFRAHYGFVATMDKEIMRDLERDVGYGTTDTWDEMPVDMPGAPATDDTELGYH
ncbi:hypothetical protein Tco_0911669 [Tanacetum coccineum]|uniref:Uncharacterized protein n=1 Tax=Tanacetum coccineum TaxID=301880 RepID=A0ABQ5D2S4_9ASTR